MNLTWQMSVETTLTHLCWEQNVSLCPEEQFVQNETKLHVLFHWVLFRKEKKWLSLQGLVGNCHLGAGTQVLPLSPTERENNPPATADYQLWRTFCLLLSLPFAATVLLLSYSTSLWEPSESPSNPTRGHVKKCKKGFLSSKKGVFCCLTCLHLHL